jgi:hypothetical protein
VLEYDATSPMDTQESSLLELMARWLLERTGEPVTAESVSDLVDVWLGVSDRADDGHAPASWTRA